MYLACCHVGLQSPAVAQEVDDVWRGHRVPLSLSTPGNVQRPSQADRGQRAEEVGEPVGTCPENRPRPGQEPHLHPLESDPRIHHLNHDGLRSYLCCCYLVRGTINPQIFPRNTSTSRHFHLFRIKSVCIVQILDTLILSVRIN